MVFADRFYHQWSDPMTWTFTHGLLDAPTTLYLVQAMTYACAASAVRSAGHGHLAGTSWASSLIHALLAICHAVGA
jgi:hypothetical protein